MTTYIPFVPNVQGPFTFQPVLDGITYAASVRWNTAAQRWYLTVVQLDGARVVTLPLISSPSGAAIENVVWANGTVTIKTATPLGYQIGTTVQLTVTGCVPVALNATWSALITDIDTFTFALTGDPGDATQLGRATYNINMVASYFSTSVLVYREDTTTFEVTP